MAEDATEKRRAQKAAWERNKYATDPAWAERKRALHRAIEKARRAGDPRYAPMRPRGFYPSQLRPRVDKKTPEARAKRRAERAAVVGALLDLYGPRCVCCDERSRRFLTIDHANRDGHVEREQFGAFGWKKRLLRRVRLLGLDARYRVLCFNCNIGRGIWGTCHDGSPLDEIPSPLPLPSRSSRGDAASGLAKPQAAQLELPTHDP